jgi:chaperonin GroES
MADIERFHPRGARVFVKPDKPADRIGSIIIPDSAKKPADTGVVMALGPGMRTKDGGRWPMNGLRRGDHVIYDARNPFTPVKFGDVELLQMDIDDIYAVIEA